MHFNVGKLPHTAICLNLKLLARKMSDLECNNHVELIYLDQINDSPPWTIFLKKKNISLKKENIAQIQQLVTSFND